MRLLLEHENASVSTRSRFYFDEALSRTRLAPPRRRSRARSRDKARRKSQSPFSSRRDQSIFIISLYQVQSQFNFHSVQRIKQSHIIQVLSNDILPKVLYEKRRNLYLERSVHRKENINIYILDLNQRVFPTRTVSL